MTKSMARNEVETTYRLDVLERKMGDLQERMNRMETLLQGMINPQTRVNEKRPMQDLGQPGDLDREMARRLDDLRQIVATGWEQDQLPDESTPEGNSKLPSTGLSLAATGWGEDPKPHAVIASPTLNNPNPSYGPEMAKDMEKGVSAVAEKHALIEGVVLNTLDKQIRHFTGSENTPMVYPLKPVIEEIQKSDLTQLYMGKRADKRLRCTGLLWKLPPWPDFCAMNCDLIAHYSGYEVLVNFHSVKQYSLSVSDYIIRVEEPLAVYKSENSLQNPHFLLNCMVLIALKKRPIDQNSQDCKIADIHYGTGVISGFVSEGSVAVSDLVVKDQEFIEATREPSLTFMVAKFDGVLGLGCQEISVGNAIPMWYNMVEQVLIVDHVFFSLWFNRRADDLSLDIPSAVTLFDKLVSIAISKEWLDASLSKSAIPDGTIVGREDKKRSQVVRNWDPGTGSKNMRWRRHVLTKDTAGSVKLWEVTREAVKTMKKAEKVLLKIKPQKGFGERGKLAAGEEGALPPNAIFLVDLESVYARARNDTGTLLVSGGTEEVVRVWDPGAGLKNMKGQGHTNNIRALLPDYMGSSEGDQSVYLTDWFLVSTSCNIPDFTYYLADNGKQWVQADGEEVSFKKLQEIPADKWAADRCGSGLIVACNNPSSPLLAGVLPSFQYGRGVYSCWLTHEVLSSETRLIFDASSLVLGLYPENFSIKQSMSSSRNSSVPDGLWEYAVNRHLAAVFGAYCYQLPRRHSPMLYNVEKHSEDYMLSKVEGLTLSNFVIGKEQNVHVEGDNICSKENNCLPGHLPSYSSEPSAAVNAPYSLGKLLQLTIVQNRSVVLGVAGASYRDMLMSWGLPVCRNPLSSNNVSFDDGHFGTQSFQQVTKVKSQVVMEILRRGCNVLLSDVDVYWFDNPVQFLYSLGPVTFAAHADEYDETGPIILPHRWNSGFYFARSDNPTITAMEMIEKYATNLGLFEQPSFYDVQCGKERANRNGDDKSVKMTKWFDTNYLFIVPEPGSSIKFSYSSHKAVNEYKKAKALVVDTVIFPVYKEVIAELKAAGASWVQFDEPTLVLDLDSYQLAAFSAAYTELELAFSGLNVLDKTYLAEGRLTEARNIFDLRVCVGVMPDVVSYNIMIYGHGFVGRMDEAVKLLDGMVLTGWKPNAFIYSTLLDGYCKEGRTEDTTTLFKEMWGKGINPGAITYIIMLDGLFKTWRTAVAKEFLKSLKVVYKLQLPKGVKIHRVSHVSQLKIHCGPKAITSPDLSLVIKDDKLRVEPISVLEIIVLLRDRLVSQQLIQWEICHLLMLMGRCQLHQCYFSRIFTHKSLNLGFLISILEDKYVFKGEGMSESGDIFGLKVCCFFGELPLRQFKQIASTARMSSYSKKEHQWPRSIPAVLV